MTELNHRFNCHHTVDGMKQHQNGADEDESLQERPSCGSSLDMFQTRWRTRHSSMLAAVVLSLYSATAALCILCSCLCACRIVPPKRKILHPNRNLYTLQQQSFPRADAGLRKPVLACNECDKECW
jgi:hypothetical protein